MACLVDAALADYTQRAQCVSFTIDEQFVHAIGRMNRTNAMDVMKLRPIILSQGTFECTQLLLAEFDFNISILNIHEFYFENNTETLLLHHI